MKKFKYYFRQIVLVKGDIALMLLQFDEIFVQKYFMLSYRFYGFLREISLVTSMILL